MLEAGVDHDAGEITLSPVVEVRGRLVGPTGFDPAGYAVRIFRAGRQIGGATVDGSGAFAIEVSAGGVDVLATRRGWWDEGYVTPAEIAGRVQAVAPAADIEVPVGAGQGRVRGSIETAAEVVQVAIFDPWAERSTRYAERTFAEVPVVVGRFETPLFTPGIYDLRVVAGDEAPVWATAVSVTAGHVADAVFERVEVTGLSVTTVDPSGAAANGATVHVSDGFDRKERRATTGEDGRASFDAPAETVRVWAELPGSAAPHRASSRYVLARTS